MGVPPLFMQFSPEIQKKALERVQSYFNDSERLSKTRREELVDVYKTYSTFKTPKQNNWSSSFKVNKAHEIVEKILPKIIAKNPRWIVSGKGANTNPEHVNAIQDYLTYVWDEYNLSEPARLWAKSMVIYGKAYAKIKYKYEIARIAKETPTLDETGAATGETETEVSEEIVGEYPTIDVKSWTEVFYDPRYILLADRPGFIEITEGIRLGSLLKKKEEYMNLDKLEQIKGIEGKTDVEEYKKALRQIAGISDEMPISRVNTESLTLKTYYGYFNTTEDPVKERLYRICTVSDLVVIDIEEITQIPFEEIKCFEDPETAHARGFVEPIIGLQDEMNFAKNSASEFINKSLTRQVLWSPNSGINPKSINDPVIVTTADGPTAQNNFVELQKPDINSAYFNKDNDLERQIQAVTFTVDTANPRNDQALTNTATGIRVKFFESNMVVDEIRKHFEQGLERLAYKLLQCAFEHMEDNIVFKKQGTDEYWQMNKAALENAITKYSIKVEANSSSFDDIESRREDAIAFFNICLQAMQAGVQVDMNKAFSDVVSTFEKRDPSKFILPPAPEALAQTMPGGATGQPVPLEGPAPKASNAASLTEQVAKGSLTTGL